MEQNRNSFPLQKCPVCGGTFFRPIETQRKCFTDCYPIDMPAWILVCLCGAPQTPNIGGLRGGRTPNLLVTEFMLDLRAAQQRREAQADRSLVEAAAQESLAPRTELKKLDAAGRRLKRQIARQQAARGAKHRSSRMPRRSAASKGRDLLALAVQKRGFTFDEARGVVKAVFDAIAKALKHGEDVDVPPLGKFSVRERPKPRLRISLGKLQHLNQQRKKVVFEPQPDLCAGGPESPEEKIA